MNRYILKASRYALSYAVDIKVINLLRSQALNIFLLIAFCTILDDRPLKTISAGHFLFKNNFSIKCVKRWALTFNAHQILKLIVFVKEIRENFTVSPFCSNDWVYKALTNIREKWNRIDFSTCFVRKLNDLRNDFEMKMALPISGDSYAHLKLTKIQ